MTEAAYAHEDPVQAVRQPASPISRGLDQRNAAHREYDAAAQLVVGKPFARVPSSSVPEVLTRDGKPLDSPLRAVMERRLSTDLGAVRVHADDHAGESARAIGAKAYAVGHHVVFGPRRFNPVTPEGKRLLAHELTHVVQQGAGSSRRQHLL